MLKNFGLIMFLSQVSRGYRRLECDMKLPNSADYSFMARVSNENLFANHSECFIIHGIPMWLKIFTTDKQSSARLRVILKAVPLEQQSFNLCWKACIYIENKLIETKSSESEFNQVKYSVKVDFSHPLVKKIRIRISVLKISIVYENQINKLVHQSRFYEIIKRTNEGFGSLYSPDHPGSSIRIRLQKKTYSDAIILNEVRNSRNTSLTLRFEIEKSEGPTLSACFGFILKDQNGKTLWGGILNAIFDDEVNSKEMYIETADQIDACEEHILQIYVKFLRCQSS